MKQEALEAAVAAVQMFHAMHPRPSAVDQKQAAEMMGVSPQTMSKLVRTGNLFTLNAAGKIPIWQVDAAIAGRKKAA